MVTVGFSIRARVRAGLDSTRLVEFSHQLAQVGDEEILRVAATTSVFSPAAQ